MPKKITKILSFLLCFLLIFQQTGFSQIAGELDISSHFQRLSGLFTQDTFRPLHLRYLSYDALSNNFNLLVDKGDTPSPLRERGGVRVLMNYFFIGLSLPNESFWVNLRPDSPDQIIDDRLAQTDIGRIMLETDLQLKKDTANYTSPNTPEGKEYWDKLYKKAEELYGNENITIPTLTRPWIVPGEIIIREAKDNAYIYKATLKVMLEQDYLKDSTTYSFKDERSQALNEYSSQLIRELIIPKLTKEVNSSKRYAPLRQVYYSLILAQWFKARYKKGLSPQGTVPNLIDSRDLTNLTSKKDWDKVTYFNAYKQSFAQGEYNIKEPVYTPTGQVIRSYFSGGIQIDNMSPTAFNIAGSPVGNKPYLIPMRIDKNGIVTQQLAGSPVISQQEIEKLKKELAFYIMGSHDLGNAARILHVLSLGIHKGILNNDEVKVDRIYNLFKIDRKYLEEGELTINEPLKLAEIIKKLSSIHEAMKLEFIRLKPFFGENLQEDIDYILDILSHEPKMYYMNLSKELEWIIDWYCKGYHYNIEFNVNTSERNNMYILGNKYLLKRVIANLIFNTEEAVIYRRIQREHIEITVKAKDDKYIITYNDNAGGVPPHLIGEIFKQGISSKNKPLSGYGLAICKDIVEKIGGTISVQSELGKGTTFTITLPAATSSPVAADSAKPAASPLKDQVKIVDSLARNLEQKSHGNPAELEPEKSIEELKAELNDLIQKSSDSRFKKLAVAMFENLIDHKENEKEHLKLLIIITKLPLGDLRGDCQVLYSLLNNKAEGVKRLKLLQDIVYAVKPMAEKQNLRNSLQFISQLFVSGLYEPSELNEIRQLIDKIDSISEESYEYELRKSKEINWRIGDDANIVIFYHDLSAILDILTVLVQTGLIFDRGILSTYTEQIIKVSQNALRIEEEPYYEAFTFPQEVLGIFDDLLIYRPVTSEELADLASLSKTEFLARVEELRKEFFRDWEDGRGGWRSLGLRGSGRAYSWKNSQWYQYYRERKGKAQISIEAASDEIRGNYDKLVKLGRRDEVATTLIRLVRMVLESKGNLQQDTIIDTLKEFFGVEIFEKKAILKSIVRVHPEHQEIYAQNLQDSAKEVAPILFSVYDCVKDLLSGNTGNLKIYNAVKKDLVDGLKRAVEIMNEWVENPPSPAANKNSPNSTNAENGRKLTVASPLTQKERVRELLHSKGIENIFARNKSVSPSLNIEQWRGNLENFLTLDFKPMTDIFDDIDRHSDADKITMIRQMIQEMKGGEHPFRELDGLELEHLFFLKESHDVNAVFSIHGYFLGKRIMFLTDHEDFNQTRKFYEEDERMREDTLRNAKTAYLFLWAAKILYEDKGAAASSPVAADSAKPAASPLTYLRSSSGESLQKIIERFGEMEPGGTMGIWDYKEDKIIRIDFWRFVESQMDKKNWVFSSEEERLEAERAGRLDNLSFENKAKKVWLHTDIPHDCSMISLIDDMSKYEHEFNHHVKNAWSVEAMARSAYKSSRDKKYVKYINNGVQHKIIIRELIYRWGLSQNGSTSSPAAADSVKPASSSLAFEGKDLLGLVHRIEPVMEEGDRKQASGTQIEIVYKAFDRDGNKLPFVIKVPREDMFEIFPRNILPFAKNYMGGIIAPFTFIQGKDAVLLGKEYPILVLQRELHIFRRGRDLPEKYALPSGTEINLLEKKNELLLKIVKRGIEYDDIWGGNEQYGLDLDTGELYFFDFSFPKFEEMDVSYIGRIRSALGWSYREAEYLESLWASERDKHTPVPEVTYGQKTAASPLHNRAGESLTDIFGKSLYLRTEKQKIYLWDHEHDALIKSELSYAQHLQNFFKSGASYLKLDREQEERLRDIGRTPNEELENLWRQLIQQEPGFTSAHTLVDFLDELSGKTTSSFDAAHIPSNWDHLFSMFINRYAMAKDAIKNADPIKENDFIDKARLHVERFESLMLLTYEIMRRWGLPSITHNTLNIVQPEIGASPLLLDERESSVLANLIEEGIVDRNIYKEGSIEYEGLIQIIRSIKKVWYGGGEVGVIRQLHKHTYLSSEGDLLKEACHFFGWVKRTMGEDAVTILFSNLILNKEIVSFPHVVMASLLGYLWEEESLRYFIQLLRRDKANGTEAWLYLFGRLNNEDYLKDKGIKIDKPNRKRILIETLKELSGKNKELGVWDIQEIVWNKMREQSSSPLGGIDMRHLAKNTVIERVGTLNSLKGQSPSGTDPKELEEIQHLIQAGIIPATKRLEECRGACSAEALLSCIADILRIEEERVTPTEAGLKNLLASL